MTHPTEHAPTRAGLKKEIDAILGGAEMGWAAEVEADLYAIIERERKTAIEEHIAKMDYVCTKCARWLPPIS